MKRVLLFLVAGLLLIGKWLHAGNPPVFGRFVGVLHHEKTNVEQLAKLDFILDRDLGNTFDLSAILTLHFGDFASREYVTYYFDTVSFDLAQGRLIFDKGDQDITVTVRRFDKDQFDGEVRSALGDNPSDKILGILHLKKVGPVEPSAPLLQPIWGNYEATNGQILQLQTFRATIDMGDVGNPFAANGIKGRMGRYDPVMGGIAVNNLFSAGSYQFFNQELTLWGYPDTVKCKVTPENLECSKGLFTRKGVSENKTLYPPTAPQRPMPVLNDGEKNEDSSMGIGGQYMGYLHHDYLDQYQIAAINIVAVQSGSGDGGVLRLSTTAKLYFGDETSSESLTYKFEPRAFPLTSKLFVFRRNGLDAILQITSAKNGSLEGIWYSRMFGRVGRFAVFKKGLPPLPIDLSLIPPVSRFSQQGVFELREIVGLGVTSPTTANPFFPLTFGGYLRDYKNFQLAKSPIRGGSYDFYTGRIAFPLSVGGEDVYMVGTRDRKGSLDLLFYLHNEWGAMLRPYRITF